jgi:hypothetical protein
VRKEARMEFRIEDAEGIVGSSVAREKSEVPSFGRRVGLDCL